MIAAVDKGVAMADNVSMKPTADSRQLYRLKDQAAGKETHATIARDFSASRMNATKWREAIDDLEDLGLRYRLRWVDVPKVSVWMGLWIPFPNSTYFDSAAVGPFRTFTIEWLEIDPFHCWAARGEMVERNQAEEIERRLQEINVPYDWVEDSIRIVGYVRNV